MDKRCDTCADADMSPVADTFCSDCKRAIPHRSPQEIARWLEGIAPGIPYDIGEVVTTFYCRLCDKEMSKEVWIRVFGDESEVQARGEHSYWSWQCGCGERVEACDLIATKPYQYKGEF